MSGTCIDTCMFWPRPGVVPQRLAINMCIMTKLLLNVYSDFLKYEELQYMHFVANNFY